MSISRKVFAAVLAAAAGAGASGVLAPAAQAGPVDLLSNANVRLDGAATVDQSGRIYARGTRASDGRVTLRATRPLKGGPYTLRRSITNRNGKRTVTKSTVLVRR
ncbi:MAG: hypothetical protein ACR2ML_11510 [Solirubrobacteraceae bacterium]